MIAYVSIEDSPMAYLLTEAHREEICGRVNRALLGTQKSTFFSSLNKVY